MSKNKNDKANPEATVEVRKRSRVSRQYRIEYQGDKEQPVAVTSVDGERPLFDTRRDAELVANLIRGADIVDFPSDRPWRIIEVINRQDPEHTWIE